MQTRIGVVGLGYVGLTLTAALAAIGAGRLRPGEWVLGAHSVKEPP